MSLLQRQMKIGDACTFRLIAKNVVSLLPASQGDLKEQTLTELENLIRCASYHYITSGCHVGYPVGSQVSLVVLQGGCLGR